jgi:hypothetical protein
MKLFRSLVVLSVLASVSAFAAGKKKAEIEIKRHSPQEIIQSAIATVYAQDLKKFHETMDERTEKNTDRNTLARALIRLNQASMLAGISGTDKAVYSKTDHMGYLTEEKYDISIQGLDRATSTRIETVLDKVEVTCKYQYKYNWLKLKYVVDYRVCLISDLGAL